MNNDEVMQRIMIFIPVLLSLTVHEWAHAFAAYKLGDDTARHQGRLSLNPLVHMDPVGTFLLPLMGVPFGWAKPVPFDPLRMRGVSIRTGTLIVAAAGPFSNAVIAIASFLALKLLSMPACADLAELLGTGAMRMLMFLLQVNIGLGLFNLIPIPPLDGSKIMDGLVPEFARPAWEEFCRLGPLLLIALILAPLYLQFSPISWVIRQIIVRLPW